MKIISQSTIAHSPAYFHLAYLAASHTAPARGLLSTGMLALLLGCVLCLRFVRGDATGKRTGPIALVLRKGNPRLLVWGLVSLAVGATIIWLSFEAGQTRYSHPRTLTKMRMHVLSDQFAKHLAEGEPMPEDIATLVTEWGVLKSGIQDGWFNEMRLVRATEEKGASYGLVSAGEDRQFDTGDDLLMAIPYEEGEPEAKH